MTSTDEIPTDQYNELKKQIAWAQDERDGWRQKAERAVELRRQAEAVCERRTAEREDARHGMKIARAERDAAQLKISELDDTLAATLENWEAYAAESGPIAPEGEL